MSSVGRRISATIDVSAKGSAEDRDGRRATGRKVRHVNSGRVAGEKNEKELAGGEDRRYFSLHACSEIRGESEGDLSPRGAIVKSLRKRRSPVEHCSIQVIVLIAKRSARPSETLRDFRPLSATDAWKY